MIGERRSAPERERLAQPGRGTVDAGATGLGGTTPGTPTRTDTGTTNTGTTNTGTTNTRTDPSAVLQSANLGPALVLRNTRPGTPAQPLPWAVIVSATFAMPGRIAAWAHPSGPPS